MDEFKFRSVADKNVVLRQNDLPVKLAKGGLKNVDSIDMIYCPNCETIHAFYVISEKCDPLFVSDAANLNNDWDTFGWHLDALEEFNEHEAAESRKEDL